MLEPRELLKRVDEKNTDSDGFLKEESLVYLIRDYARRGNDDVVDQLSDALALRSMKFVKSQVRKFVDSEYLEDCRNDILLETFDRILDLESDRADYLEASFWNFLQRISGDVTQKYKTVSKRDRATDSFDVEDETELGSVSRIGEAGINPTEDLLRRIHLDEVLLLLPPHIQELFVMHYLDGYAIESNDPHIPTLARHFNKTPRTIRNWLAQGVRIVTSGAGAEK